MTTLEMPPFPLDEAAGPGRDGDPDEVLLVVGEWRSRCSHCRTGATTTERSHSTWLGLGPVGRGCGRSWTGVAVAWEARIGAEERVEAIAAELGVPFVGRRDWPRGGVA